MTPDGRRELGSTGVDLTQLGFGAAGLGSLRALVSEDAAVETLRAAWDAGIRYYDTAPWYGRGLSERRVGCFLRDRPRDQFVLSTKVGRMLRPARDPGRFDPAPWAGGLPFEVVFDYSYDGIMRSYEDSLRRLGLPSVDVLLIHDLDRWYHREPALGRHWTQLAASGWRALAGLRESGAVRAVGAGINDPGLIPRFVERFDIDLFLVAMRYTLLDQSALTADLPLCADRGIGVVAGAVFNSGILATGSHGEGQHNYEDADEAVLDRVRRLEAACQRHGISLQAAALQFPLGHPSVASVIPGAIQPEQIGQNARAFQEAIPPSFWDELKAQELLPADAPAPT